jgi:hypothetical protein
MTPHYRATAGCLLLAVAGYALSSAGCAALTGESPAARYVTADKAVFNAVGPEYSAYVTADPRLTPEQKARRQRTLGTWRLRIETAIKEQSTAAAPPETAPAVQPIP